MSIYLKYTVTDRYLNPHSELKKCAPLGLIIINYFYHNFRTHTSNWVRTPETSQHWKSWWSFKTSRTCPRCSQQRPPSPTCRGRWPQEMWWSGSALKMETRARPGRSDTGWCLRGTHSRHSSTSMKLQVGFQLQFSIKKYFYTRESHINIIWKNFCNR